MICVHGIDTEKQCTQCEALGQKDYRVVAAAEPARHLEERVSKLEADLDALRKSFYEKT